LTSSHDDDSIRGQEIGLKQDKEANRFTASRVGTARFGSMQLTAFQVAIVTHSCSMVEKATAGGKRPGFLRGTMNSRFFLEL
jgi:hypothetical protein